MAKEQDIPADMIAIGHVRRAVGLDGRVEIELYSGDIARLSPGTEIMADQRPLVVERSAPSRKGLFAVRFEGVEDRDAADTLRGSTLQMAASALPPAADGSYYHFQLMGSVVEDVQGRQVGVLSGIMETGANDVYVVSTPEGKEILVPATRNVVKDVDTVTMKIVVDLPGADQGAAEIDKED